MTAALTGRPRLRLPATAQAGEVVEIRTLVDHPMETGLRKGDDGQPVPRDMLARLIVRANGAVVFTAEFRNATSANPYLVFFLTIERTTELDFTWLHEDGRSLTAAARIVVA